MSRSDADARVRSASRRALVAGFGAVALGAAGSLAAASPAQAAPTAAGAKDITRADSVSELSRRRARDGEVAIVAGYRTPGDAGLLVYVGVEAADIEANGGTVIAGKRGSRWLLQHDGTVDFRVFGITGPETAADDALAAMVNDVRVKRIAASTDLLFQRRHRFTRSHIEIDFGGHVITTDGIEANTHDNPFGAVMFFTGVSRDVVVEHRLAEAWPELTDAVTVPDAAAFPVDSWWALQCDTVAGGGADEREIQRFVRVTQQIDGTHIRIDYLNGWPLDTGRKLIWRRMDPVEGVRISNMRFLGAGPFDGPTDGSFPDSRELTGSHPIAFEYAIHCDVADVHASRTWWPVIMRRWNTHFTTERCSVENPPTVFYGGAGYLTQQIYSLYGRVSDCTSSNARHLNDLTASAYCIVENCHGDGDDQGGNPFTTHGQYEHDLTFIGCSGLMDIANSGAQWGTAAKRITIRDHVCSWFVAGTKISDLTLENVRVIGRSTFDPQATMTINADGAQLRGCTAGLLAIGQRSTRSSRPTTIEDCTFALPKDQVLIQTPVTVPVSFARCTITGIDGMKARGSGAVEFVDCRLSGPATGAPAELGGSRVTIRGGTVRDVVLTATAVRDQAIVLEGVELSTERGEGAMLSRAGGAGVITWRLSGVTSTVPKGAAHVDIGAGINHARVTGAQFVGGRLRLAAGFSEPSTLLYSDTVERGVETDLPADGERVLIADVLKTA
ncbi:peptidase C14 [Microbacterium maritypicum]|uniref:Peptidase C14 n=1 Tax=Microbacterium maritypicum TaxID=33918 RepID=A0AAD3X1S9_MICMQ|nr:peptidase C14 [Microbacterium liquefaciens]KAB1881372.1 peptidase C14 [Microbacterium liquefaciens]